MENNIADTKSHEKASQSSRSTPDCQIAQGPLDGSSTTCESSGVPKFLCVLTDARVKVGRPARLLVQVQCQGPYKVVWFHNDVKFQDQPPRVLLTQFESEEDSNTPLSTFHCVQFNEVWTRDAGKWACKVVPLSDKLKNHQSSISIAWMDVLIPRSYKPPIFLQEELEGILWDNGSISLQCQVQGTPCPSLRWYRNGIEITEGEQVKLLLGSKDTRNHLGLFICQATNCMGSVALFSNVYALQFVQFVQKCTSN